MKHQRRRDCDKKPDVSERVRYTDNTDSNNKRDASSSDVAEYIDPDKGTGTDKDAGKGKDTGADKDQVSISKKQVTTNDDDYDIDSEYGLLLDYMDYEDSVDGEKRGPPDVVEGFFIGKILGGIIKPAFKYISAGFKVIGDWIKKLPIIGFFGNLVLLGAQIFELCSELGSNPFMTILKILMLIGGCFLSMAAILLYILLSLGPAQLVGIIFAFMATWVICMGGTLLLGAYILFMTLLFAILWVLNLFTNGALTFLLRCENSPDAWYSQPGYAFANKFRRMFLCFQPCSPCWKRSSGIMCKKLQRSFPAFCPQQQIFGLYQKSKEHENSDPALFNKHIPDPSFYKAKLAEREALILDSLRQKKQFLGGCHSGLQRYNYLTKHICANVETVDGLLGAHPAEPNGTATSTETLKSACRQVYCDYAVSVNRLNQPEATRIATPPCQWCNATKKIDLQASASSVRASEIFMTCLLLLMIGLIMLFVLFSLCQYSSKMPVNFHARSRDQREAYECVCP